MADFKIIKIRYTWKNSWAASTDYIKDDVVYYGGKTYVCFVTHTSSPAFLTDFSTVVPKWVLMFDGFTWRNVWTISTLYNPGDTVKYGGVVYRCITSHTSAATTALGLENAQANWTSVARTEDWKNTWTVSTRYKVNDIVKYGATVYRCTLNHTSAATVALGLEDNLANWEVVSRQYEFLNEWTAGVRYKLNDVVHYSASQWLCTTPHTAAATFGLDEANWDVYIEGLVFKSTPWDSLSFYSIGDLVSYGGYSYRAIDNGTNKIPSTQTLFWQLVTEDYRFRNDWLSSTSYLVGDTVRLNGYVYIATTDNSNKEPPNLTYWKVVVPGKYWTGQWATATNYKLEDLATWGSTTYECKLAHTSTTAIRPDIDEEATFWKIYVGGNTNNKLAVQGDLLWYDNGSTDRLPAGSQDDVLQIGSAGTLNWDTFTYIPKVWYVATTGIDNIALGYGTTINKPFRTVKYACQNVTGPATIFIKTGIFSEEIPISIPANVALVGDELRGTVIQPTVGREGNDMFYVRNGTGIRNMTLQGLNGTLGAANSYLTRRPTAGAFVSLDPGAGPSDSNVWITSKSPYVQNVTTFGDGCVGMKVDGGIHQGGNKSIVANDFTQVLSNGIGMWITNLARAELVSVFTYYCHIGYLAENGGKIRATNGNNSYGDYGAVAEGVSIVETPITGQINNRSQQAAVGFVFTDGDQILNFEYSNCGNNYTTANFTFGGSGLGASVNTPTIVNGGVYEIRLTDPGVLGQAPGGGGYLGLVNNAQTGLTTGSITLSQADDNEPGVYIGMRVVIISGKGVGQYGYITSYSDVTKIAVINKESDGSVGWDHMLPGTVLEDLDTTSQYSIEPRVTISAPASGVRAIARVTVTQGRIGTVRIVNPGSGYTGVPTVTLTDPNQSSAASLLARVGDGVLGTPSFTSRGTGYITASATISGDGYKDQFQLGSYLWVKNLTYQPNPGANVIINGIETVYRLVDVDNIQGTLGNQTARIRVSPYIETAESPIHLTTVTIREQYSQCRLTGHDFLDIGTGDKAITNYPGLPFSPPEQPAEAAEGGGGRVFYTSTDQDGNFRVGELFRVQQSTGIVTLSAEDFQLEGLTELRLGGVVLGGTGAVVREFSTDTTFSANSNSIVPTQKAIKAYVNSRIGGGGSNLVVSSLTAGSVAVSTDTIVTTNSNRIDITTKAYFKGSTNGRMLAMPFFISAGG